MIVNVHRLTATIVGAAVLGAVDVSIARAHRASQAAPPAQILLSEAANTARAENKNVLVIFGASWCGWCRKLDRLLAAPAGSAIANHFVVVELTVQESQDKKALENPGGDLVMAQLGGANAGLPFYAFLDAAGKTLANSNAMANGGNLGYPGDAQEVAAFDRLLQKTAPRMTSAERARIAEYLHAHP